MGKKNTQLCKRNGTIAVSGYSISISTLIQIIVTLLGGAYMLGRYHMEANKNQEVIIIVNNLERQHRDELSNKDAIIDEKDSEIHHWREKYFLLLNAQTHPSNNSP